MYHRILIGAGLATLAFAAHASLAPSEEEFEDLELSLQVSGDEEEIALLIAMEVAEELTGVDMMDPAGNRVLELRSGLSSGLGECVFETRSGLDDLDDYPEGPYRVLAYAPDGTVYCGVAQLTHDLPGRPEILWPDHGAHPANQVLQLQWNATDADRVRVEVDGEERSLDVWLPGDDTTFLLPASMMAPGAEYKITVTAVAENGNRVEVEHPFWVDR